MRRPLPSALATLAFIATLAACAPGPGRRETPQPGARAASRPVAASRSRESRGVRTYVVRRGDTGIAIARDQGVRWTDVVTLNKLEPPYLLRIGDRLLLPANPARTAPPPRRRPSASSATARPPAAPSIETRARAFNLDVETLITDAEPAGRRTPAQAASPAPRAIAGAPAFRWPVDGRILTSFGPKPAGRFNDGINLKAGAGSPVRAAADGTVAYAGDAITGFGNLVLVRHAGGWVTAYGHNEALLVQRGTTVKAGEPIARVGSTGAVTEPQLHFEIRSGRTAIDPLKLLPPR